MKLTASRQTSPRDAEPGEIFVNDDGRWVIDELRLKRDAIELMCFAEGSDSTRRKSIEVKGGDTITVEACPEDGLELLSMLNKLLLGKAPVEGSWHRFASASGELELMLGTRVVGECAGRIWSVTLAV